MPLLDRPIKKEGKNEAQNYRSVGILSILSKVYERCLFNEIATYFDNILSKHQYYFRKGFSSKYCLEIIIEKKETILILFCGNLNESVKSISFTFK